MAARREVKQAFLKPASAYDRPAGVLADDSLSNAEKRRILENWEREAREQADASQENKAGGESDRLAEVGEALAKLPPDDKVPRGSGTVQSNQPAPSSTPKASGGTTLSARDARQGEIILKTPLRRAIFIGGLVLAAVVCVFLFYGAMF